MASPRLQAWKQSTGAGTIGLEVALSVVFGLVLGRWLDGKLDTAPYLSVAGFFLGVATAVRAIVRGWKEMQRITRREEEEEGNPAPMFEPTEPKDREDRERRSPKGRGPGRETKPGPPGEEADGDAK